jgi:hypothetical protein
MRVSCLSRDTPGLAAAGCKLLLESGWDMAPNELLVGPCG